MSIKFTYEEVREYLNKLGYKLLSDKYENNNTILIFKDTDNYLYHISLRDFKKNNNIPSKFSKSNPYTIQNIKLWCDLNNKSVELLNDQKYKGVYNKLKLKCVKAGCNEEFEMSWDNLYHGQSCPYCCIPAKKVGLSNCLATRYPDLVKEWHSTKNGDLTPYNVTCGTHKEIWWECESGHEWKANLINRIKGQGCPYCYGRYPTQENNLLIYSPELINEWDYIKNKKKPEEYLPYSNKKVWWICKECGFRWRTSINNRNNGRGCPECNKSKGEKKIKNILDNYNFIGIIQEDFNQLNDLDKMRNIYYIPQKKFNGLIGLGNNDLLFDFYLSNSQHNLLIEYDGEFHYQAIKLYKNEPIKYAEERLKKQQEHDRRKDEYAKEHGITLLRIPYWDYDNIEKILDEYFNKENNINIKAI